MQVCAGGRETPKNSSVALFYVGSGSLVLGPERPSSRPFGFIEEEAGRTSKAATYYLGIPLGSIAEQAEAESAWNLWHFLYRFSA